VLARGQRRQPHAEAHAARRRAAQREVHLAHAPHRLRVCGCVGGKGGACVVAGSLRQQDLDEHKPCPAGFSIKPP
jgi:hypothetical protein